MDENIGLKDLHENIGWYPYLMVPLHPIYMYSNPSFLESEELGNIWLNIVPDRLIQIYPNIMCFFT